MLSNAHSTAEPTGRQADASRQRRSRLVLLLPLVVFFGLGLAFAVRLDRDPSKIPSALIGKPVPVFSLPPVKGRELGLSNTDLDGAEYRSSTSSPRAAWPAGRSMRCSCSSRPAA